MLSWSDVNPSTASTPARLYYCGLAGTFLLQFLHEVFMTTNSILVSFTEGIQKPVDEVTSCTLITASESLGCKISDDKVQELFGQLNCYLPLMKIWYDWLSCQWQLWSDCCQEIKSEFV